MEIGNKAGDSGLMERSHYEAFNYRLMSRVLPACVLARNARIK